MALWKQQQLADLQELENKWVDQVALAVQQAVAHELDWVPQATGPTILEIIRRTIKKQMKDLLPI